MATISNANFNPQTFEEAGTCFIQAITEKEPETTLQQIAEKTAELCRGMLFSFIKTFSGSEGNASYFFNLVIKAIKEELITKPLSKRLIYEIKDKENVVGYIIGTIHDQDQSLIGQNEAVNQDPVLHETVRKCRALVTELGLSSYGLDKALVETARASNIQIFALETKEFQEKLALQICTNDEQLIEKPKQAVRERLDYLLPRHDLFKILGFHSYLTGNIAELQLIKDMDSAFENNLEIERHQKWLNKPITGITGLAWQLEFYPSLPQKPLAIAANVMSLFGEYGLIRQLSTKFSVSPV